MGHEKTALVLSAGGMFGAYQAGAWQELHGRFRPDLVVGASIGSLNGWMIAGGITGDELAARWLGFERVVRHRWRVPRLLPNGIIDPAHVGGWIRAIHAEFSPRTEYGLVTTSLPSLRPRLFRYPEVRYEHLACSCAVPLVLRQSRIETGVYCDGGIMIPLPLWAAVEMGATRIVAVNLLPIRPPLIAAFARALAWYCRWNQSLPSAIRLTEIAPRGRLGSIRDSMYWSRANIERWIERGRTDARLAGENISM
ncbi:MAG TPA: patatin-like phospholipase family protein [Bryobacteraceae bacterium]|nr:patatin-like phospholipase family protein [Bryobacteraceae bacterium]